MATVEIRDRELIKSTRLSSYWKQDMIAPLDVIAVLNDSKISFVLVGAYGLAGWLKEPRATEDVDVIVATKQVKKAVRELLSVFPDLEPIDLPVVVRLKERDTDDVVIDVMKPVQQPHKEVFKYTVKLSSEGQDYRVPTLEMAIVMKFAAMISLYRASKDKHQDAHDFINLVMNNPDFDKQKVEEIAALIYPDGGKDALDYARRALAGDTFSV